jgi:hypothetical protein
MTPRPTNCSPSSTGNPGILLSPCASRCQGGWLRLSSGALSDRQGIQVGRRRGCNPLGRCFSHSGPWGCSFFEETGARVTASRLKRTASILLSAQNSRFAWDSKQRRFRRLSVYHEEVGRRVQRRSRHIRIERILLFIREIQTDATETGQRKGS